MNVWEWNIETDVIEASENAEEFWGAPMRTLGDFHRVVEPADHDIVRRARDRALGGAPYEAEYRVTRDGKTRWIYSRGQHVKRPDGELILGASVDITQRKQAEMANRILADAGESLGASLDVRVILANLCRVVVPRLADWCTIDLVDDNGGLDRVAAYHPDPQRVAAVMALSRNEPVHRDSPHGPWRVLRTGEPDIVSDVSELQYDPAFESKRISLVDKIGLESFICVPLVARNKTIGTLTLSYAESGRRFRREDLGLATEIARRAASAVDNAHLYTRLREEDRRKDEFLATLAHELRNPLAPLGSGLELLRKMGDPRLEKTRVIMDRQLTHLVRLVDDLLDVSRVTRGKVVLRREPLDVESLVSTALEVSRSAIDKAGLELTVSLPKEPLAFEGDRTRIAQVLSNLLNNAAKYNVPGGKVSVRAYRDGSDVVFEIADTGVGIPREMHEQIFEMFVQVHRNYEQPQGGLGIGLTLVRRLVELHGGRVWVESNGDGEGSKFVVRLPGVVETTAPAPSIVETKSKTPRRILVVDDNEDAIFTLSSLLELDGHEVRTATSGPHALEVLRDFKPDIALLDIGLPGMSGYELARHLRSQPHFHRMTLVALTGWGQDEDRRQSQEAGFHHHFTKPVDLRKLQSLFE
jgi:signal transduction histidine kinase